MPQPQSSQPSQPFKQLIDEILNAPFSAAQVKADELLKRAEASYQPERGHDAHGWDVVTDRLLFMQHCVSEIINGTQQGASQLVDKHLQKLTPLVKDLDFRAQLVG